MLKWLIFTILIGLLHSHFPYKINITNIWDATLQQNDCISSTFPVQLRPSVNIKVIQTGIKLYSLEVFSIIPSLKQIASSLKQIASSVLTHDDVKHTHSLWQQRLSKVYCLGPGGIKRNTEAVHLLAGCSTSQQHASVSLGRICMCCHTETEVAGQTFHLSQS